MKKFMICFSVVLIILFGSGCGSSQTTEGVSMVIGESVLVTTGDIIIPTSDDTQIEVLHYNDDGSKYVVLTAGSANFVDS